MEEHLSPFVRLTERHMALQGSANLHTVFTSECNNHQFDWFTVGVYESFRASGMQGSITRLLACSQEDLKGYKGLDLGPTFVHPNYRHNPLNGDTSASYNKPASVMHFSREANFTEEYVLFIDADMVLSTPIDPVALGAKPGTVVSEFVPYMIGTGNGMAAQFLPSEAVPRAKSVGWYHIFHRDDLRRIAPLWLKYCGRVRTEPERYWRINGSIPADIPTGDAYVKFGKAPWIAEMYGYAFGAAEAGVEHVITHGVVRYPGEVSNYGEQPHILHYGIDFTILPDYNWNKMSYQKLDLFACNGRYFGPPPAGDGGHRHSAMRYVVNTLNKAFCEFYHSRCPGTPAATRRCPQTTRPEDGAGAPCVRAEGELICCKDDSPSCWQWALDEQCEQNKGFMQSTCKLSCGICPEPIESTGGGGLLPTSDSAGAPKLVLDSTHRALAKLESGLQPFLSEADAGAAKSFSALKASGTDAGDAAAAALPHAALQQQPDQHPQQQPQQLPQQQSPRLLQGAATASLHDAAWGRLVGVPRVDGANAHEQVVDLEPVDKSDAALDGLGTRADGAGKIAESSPDLGAISDGAATPSSVADVAEDAAVRSVDASRPHGVAPTWVDDTDPTLHLPRHTAPATNARVHTAARDTTATRDATAAAVAPATVKAESGASPARANNGAAIMDEFRRVATQHSAEYAPGHVPQWLKRQAKMEGALGQGGVSASASRDEEQVAVADQSRHRFLLLSLLALWLSIITLAVVRWLGLCSCRGSKRRRRPDLLHRY